MLVNREDKILILENELSSQHDSFTEELNVEREKLKIQNEITKHSESVAGTYKSENEDLKKKVRRLKWQRAGLGLLTVAVIIISL
jgi:hypothetical protein